MKESCNIFTHITISFRNFHLHLVPHFEMLCLLNLGDDWNFWFNIYTSFYNPVFKYIYLDNNPILLFIFENVILNGILVLKLVFYCCYKWPQTLWLKTTKIYCSTVVEVGSLKSFSGGKNQSIGRAVLLLRALGDKLSPCLLQLPAFHGLWPYITPTSGSIIILLSLPLLPLSHCLRRLWPFCSLCDYIVPSLG